MKTPMLDRRITVWLLAVCSLLASVTAIAQDAGRPRWADIGFIPANQSELFFAVSQGNIYARKKPEIRASALAEIASQIEVEVAADIRSQTQEFESNGQSSIHSKFDEIIRTATNTTFYGEDLHEKNFFDEAKNVYWVYLYITKADLKRRMEERKNISIAKTRARFLSGQEAERSGQYVQALDNYWAALKEMRDFSAYPLKTTVGGKEILLNSTVPNRLQSLVGAIHIEPEAQKFSYKLSEPKTPSFRAYFLKGQKKKPVLSLPVKFSVNDEAAVIRNTGTTDAKGLVSCLIEKGKWSAEGMRIYAAIDWQGSFDDLAMFEFYNLKMDSSNSIFLDVFLQSPQLYLNPTYHSRSPAIKDAFYSMDILRGAIVEYLTTAVNARFTASPQEADMQLDVQVNATSLGEAIPGFKSVRANLLLKLTDPRTKKVAYSPRSKSVTKAALTEVQALEKTFESLVKYIEKELLKPIVTRLGG